MPPTPQFYYPDPYGTSALYAVPSNGYGSYWYMPPTAITYHPSGYPIAMVPTGYPAHPRPHPIPPNDPTDPQPPTTSTTATPHDGGITLTDGGATAFPTGYHPYPPPHPGVRMGHGGVPPHPSGYSPASVPPQSSNAGLPSTALQHQQEFATPMFVYDPVTGVPMPVQYYHPAVGVYSGPTVVQPPLM
ncbi:hypothetical protein HDU67_009701, partial [Dinochytrium kinnereticum]